MPASSDLSTNITALRSFLAAAKEGDYIARYTAETDEQTSLPMALAIGGTLDGGEDCSLLDRECRKAGWNTETDDRGLLLVPRR